jgi:hypothetical protein
LSRFEGTWHKAPETKVTPYRLKAPYDNVYVGEDPGDGMTQEYADQFDAIVNVSCTECALFEPSRPDQRTYWYPINEMGRWSLGYLFWLKKVMDFHHDKGHRIYLHCHAGAYRSPSAAVLWLQSRGHTPLEAISLGAMRCDKSALYSLWKSHGNIPKMKDALYESMRNNKWNSFASHILSRDFWNRDLWNPEIAAPGHMMRAHILHRYFWFYYQPKYWLKGKWENAKYWWEGCGYHEHGYGKYIYPRKNFWEWPLDAEPEDASYTAGIGKTWDKSDRTFRVRS